MKIFSRKDTKTHRGKAFLHRILNTDYQLPITFFSPLTFSFSHLPAGRHGFLTFIFFLFPFFYSARTSAQSFYDIDTIQKIEISFSQSNWNYILDTAKQDSDSYTMAQWVKINGVQFDSAGVKYKGNSSYNPDNAKNPLHIELDHFKSQNYQGYKDIKLSNGYIEPSFIREVLIYSMLQNYMQAPLANFAQGYINGQYMGVYTNVETVTKTFLNNRFYSGNNTFILGDEGGCDLRYKGNDSTLYYNPYTLKSDYGWADLMNLCDTLKNNINGIENILDVDRSLWMLAYTNVLVILDSYLGNYKHNYYIYEDHNGRFNPIIWDVNAGFGTNAKIDAGPDLSVAQLQNLPPMIKSEDSLSPLVKNLFNVSMLKRMYIAHIRTIVNENFADSGYYTDALYLQSIIDTAVQSDPNKFFTYSQFLSNLTTNVIFGTRTIPGITLLMDARTTYLNSTTEFQQVPPTISNILPSDNFPLINTTVFITANISNATAVFLERRYSVMEKFSKMQMYDDGTHGDGAAADGTYGVSVSVTSPEIQYYIYAENNNAGIFSPERAEHEWYTLHADYATINAGEVVINEIMAVNNSTVQNGNGQYGDWVELYNNSANTVLLDNLNLSDDAASPAKWQFPLGLSIPPYGFLTVWADNDTSSTELHCDFKFSSSGEQVILAYANGYVVDSISFPNQAADTSWGRYPNGTGAFVFMPPSFNADNSIFTNAEEYINESNSMRIFPNPSTGQFTIYNLAIAQSEIYDLKIFSVLGNVVFYQTRQMSGSKDSGLLRSGHLGAIAREDIKHLTLNLNLESGIYFLQIKTEQRIVNKKIIIQK